MVATMFFGENLYTLKKNTDASLVANRLVGMAVNAKKTKYIRMFKTCQLNED
jgi:hypothetical protein